MVSKLCPNDVQKVSNWTGLNSKNTGLKPIVCDKTKGDHLIKKSCILMGINYQLLEEGDDQGGRKGK